jgi:hypothetical protein
MRLVSGLILASAIGCGGGSKGAKDATSVGGTGLGSGAANLDLKVPKVDDSLCETKGKKVATFDLNQDSRPDVWKIYRELDEKGTTLERLSCKQVDLDHDGRKDYVVQYDDQGAILVEDFDFDFDARFDARFHYDKKSGKKFLVERVSGFAKRTDLWEKYDTSEKLESLRRDRNVDGKPDYWEQYTAGVLDKILYDDDFDGKVDRQDERAGAAPPPGVPGLAPSPALPGPEPEKKPTSAPPTAPKIEPTKAAPAGEPAKTAPAPEPPKATPPAPGK